MQIIPEFDARNVEIRQASIMDEVKLPGSMAHTSKRYMWNHNRYKVYAARKHKGTVEQLVR